MHRIILPISVLLIVVGCRPSLYHFTFPRENRPVASPFIANADYRLSTGSPAPDIALYLVAADPGRSRPGVVCYVPTQIEVVHDQSGPKLWKRKSQGRIEYVFVAAPSIDRDKYKNLRDAITSNTPGVTATLVPCELLVNSIDIPGTLSGVQVNIASSYSVAGDSFWIVRLYAKSRLETQLDTLMQSVTGLLLPTRATLSGMNIAISPTFEIKGMVPMRED